MPDTRANETFNWDRPRTPEWWDTMGAATGSYVLIFEYKFWARTTGSDGLQSFEYTAQRHNGRAQVWQEHQNGAVRIY